MCTLDPSWYWSLRWFPRKSSRNFLGSETSIPYTHFGSRPHCTLGLVLVHQCPSTGYIPAVNFDFDLTHVPNSKVKVSLLGYTTGPEYTTELTHVPDSYMSDPLLRYMPTLVSMADLTPVPNLVPEVPTRHLSGYQTHSINRSTSYFFVAYIDDCNIVGNPCSTAPYPTWNQVRTGTRSRYSPVPANLEPGSYRIRPLGIDSESQKFGAST